MSDTVSLIQEQVDLSKIATFRNQWTPQEYLPLPEWLVYVDLAVLLILMMVGSWFVVTRKPARWLTWLAVLTLAYLGILRGGCICPMGLTTNMVMGIILPYMISLVGLMMFMAPLVIALLWGRVFCTAGCPLGAIQHLVYKKKKTYKVPAKINRFVKVVPILVLLATVYFGITGTLYPGCELDPYKPVFFTGKAWFEQGIAAIIGFSMEPKLLLSFSIFGWIYLVVTLLIGYWIERPFCRLLCPYSALLGLFSMVSWQPRRIDKAKCTSCSLCVKSCPTQAITISKNQDIQKVSSYDCIQCNRCSDRCKEGAI
ncbi:MAG: 4Fe-4S binding protein [Bacteroidota bacterium]